MSHVTLNPALEEERSPAVARHASTSCRRPSSAGEPPTAGMKPAWADEWQEGAPASVGAAALAAIDLQVYRHARCGRCQKRTLTIRPQHHYKDGRYRLLGTCRTCQAEMVF